jgi:hypothetical protein
MSSSKIATRAHAALTSKTLRASVMSIASIVAVVLAGGAGTKWT